MRSLYTRIFLTCCATLFLALCAFLTISLVIGVDRSVKNFGHVFNLELSLAERIYREQGRDALAEFLKSSDASFASRHYIVDRRGRDLVTGEDRSAMMVRPVHRRGLFGLVRRVYRFVADAEGRSVVSPPGGELTIIVVARPWANARAQLPYYLLVLIAVSILNSLVAARIVSAIRAMARAAERFGEGELETRVRESTRQDEVGVLASAFNRMAGRIRDLVLSERRLLQDVSHELRSPLARLAFAVELAKTSDDRAGAIGLVEKQIQTLKALVSSLLQVTRVREGAFRDVEEFRLADVIDDIVEANDLNAREKGCRILVAGTISPCIAGDRRSITRALDNVVRNAIEYSSPGSQIDVTLTEERDGAAVHVRDYGSGVPDTMLTNIFEPFFRVDDCRHASTGGVGLGLAIVQRAVQQHGGSVRATNAEPGLMVSITLPAAWSEARSLPRSAA
jgi:two-component system sensor histidine kinase CpxA